MLSKKVWLILIFNYDGTHTVKFKLRLNISENVIFISFVNWITCTKIRVWKILGNWNLLNAYVRVYSKYSIRCRYQDA